MPFIADAAFDAGLNIIRDNATHLTICSSEPNNYASVATVKLGEKQNVAIGEAQNNSPTGRKIVVGEITDGNVTASGTATHWALHNNTDTLYASGTLTSKNVVAGNLFTLDTIDISFSDAAGV